MTTSLFRDIYVGWPGSVHDALNSVVYKKAASNEILYGENVNNGGVDVPIFLIGDSAYPFKYIIDETLCSQLKLDQRTAGFNNILSEARVVIENAFGRLIGRWRRLAKHNDMDVHNVPWIVTACCILHNLCEVHGITYKFKGCTLIQPTAPPLVTNSSNAAK